MSDINDNLARGCVVRMKASSGLVGHGNEQCVSGVCEQLGTLSLFGHNQHYKTYDVAEIVECPEQTADALEQSQADIQEQHDDLIEETLRANTAEARIEQLEAALSAALDWSEAIEQGPFGDKRPDIARVEFHAFAKGLIDCSHLPNLRHLSSPSVEDTSND